IGRVAIGPIAIGGVTIGLLSLSLWGVALGVLTVGSAAAGWWAFGVAAFGWRSAAGAVAFSPDYALGMWAHATEANTAVAKEWFHSPGFIDGVISYFSYGHWGIVLAVVAALAVKAWRGRFVIATALLAACLLPSCPESKRTTESTGSATSAPALANSSRPTSEGTVDANGITIAYESFGSAEHETVLLIMGTGGQLTMWPVELCEELVKRGYR